MSITQTEADNAKAAFAVQIDAMVSGTSPTGESPSGTYLPPAAVITDANTAKWTLDAVPFPPYGFKIFKNGQWATGIAKQLAYCGGKVLCFNGQNYFEWNGSAWLPRSQPFCQKTN